MKPASAILVSGAVAAVISLMTAASVSRASGAPAVAPPPPQESLRPQLDQLRAEVHALRSRVESIPAATTAAASKPEAPLRPAAAPAPSSVPKDVALADALRILLRQGMAPDAVQKLFESARKSGSIDALIRSIEAVVEENPQDALAHCLLARSCIEALMVEPDFIKKGDWARRADAEYLKAIDRDPACWEAVYGRAVSLSWWPEQLGKLPEAIKGFEQALELQAGSSAQPRYADTYAQLARLYLKVSKTEKAAAVLAEGLRIFPGQEELQKQLELIQKR